MTDFLEPVRKDGLLRLSKNLFVGDGALDVPFENVSNPPKVQ